MRASQRLLRSTRARSLTPFRRPASCSSAVHARLLSSSPSRLTSPLQTPLRSQYASFSTRPSALKGLQPGSSEPASPNTEPTTGSGSAAQISDSEYHEIADQYLNSLVLATEELAESSSEGIEAEFSAGVFTITHPKAGTYVINKQPPNKQIWLSSPVSGPKRYDWVVSGEGQHEKEGSTVDVGDDGAGGRWTYLRDGSSLTELIKKELGVEFTPENEESDVVTGRK